MNQTFPVNFQGVQEGADPKALPPGTMLLAKNCRMDKARRLRKRGGVRKLSETGIVSEGGDTYGARLFESGDGGLGLITGEQLYAYSAHRARWEALERVYPFLASKRPLTDSYKSVAFVDIAMSGNLLITVWMNADPRYGSATPTGQQVFVQVHDVRTWDLVLEPTRITSNGSAPRVIVLGTTAHIFYMSNTNQLVTNKLSLSTFAVTAAINAFAGYAGKYFDVDTNGVDLFTIGILAAGANRVEVRRINAATHAATTTATLGGTPAYVSCSVDCGPATLGGKAQILIAYEGAAGSTAAILSDTTLATAIGPVAFHGVSGSPSQVFAMYDDQNDDIIAGRVEGTLQTETLVYATLATVAATTRHTRDVVSVSKPFRFLHDGMQRWFTSALVLVGDENNEYSTPSQVLVELRIDASAGDEPTHRQAATLENGTGWSWSASSHEYFGQSVYSSSRREAYVVSTFRQREGKYADVIGIGANINIVQAAKGDRAKALRAGNTVLITGAVPLCFDSANAQPYGFTHAPQIVSTTPGGGGSGAMAAGAYQYQACFVRVGPDGIKQRSPMSDIVSSGAVVATGSCALVFHTTGMSCKLDEDDFASHLLYANYPYQTFIEIYRTTVNGDVLHRLTIAPAHNFVQNNPLALTVTFTDTRSDTDITNPDTPVLRLDAQPQPYTELELDDIPPPACGPGTVHRDRFAVVDSTGFNVWLSKKASDDLTIAPGFNEALVLSFSRKKIALLSLDEKLVAWDEDGIDIVHGDGPDAAGGGAGWELGRVQSDVGCKNPRSVVATPMGAVFESRRGLEILSRDLTVSRIGKSIEDTLADFPFITSAVLVEKHHEVRFTCNSVDQGEDSLTDDGEIVGTGIVIAWDYLHNVWFVREYTGYGNEAQCPFVDALAIDGVYYLLDPLGRVYVETFDDCFDQRGSEGGTVSVWVGRDIKLAPFSPSGGGLGWHRVKDVVILGTSQTPHVLEVSAEQDFDELDGSGYAQVETFAEGSEATVVGATNKARVTFAEQKCQALSLRIRDLTPASLAGHTGEGPILESLMFRAQTKRGPVRVSDGESK